MDAPAATTTTCSFHERIMWVPMNAWKVTNQRSMTTSKPNGRQDEQARDDSNEVFFRCLRMDNDSQEVHFQIINLPYLFVASNAFAVRARAYAYAMHHFMADACCVAQGNKTENANAFFSVVEELFAFPSENSIPNNEHGHSTQSISRLEGAKCNLHTFVWTSGNNFHSVSHRLSSGLTGIRHTPVIITIHTSVYWLHWCRSVLSLFNFQNVWMTKVDLADCLPSPNISLLSFGLAFATLEIAWV